MKTPQRRMASLDIHSAKDFVEEVSDEEDFLKRIIDKPTKRP